jgi:hypothetical protein
MVAILKNMQYSTGGPVPSISITPQNPNINVFKIQSAQKILRFTAKMGRTNLRLAEQIYNRIIRLAGFD